MGPIGAARAGRSRPPGPPSRGLQARSRASEGGERPVHVGFLDDRRPEEIDVARARVAGERAEQRLRAAATEETDVDRALASFARARARLQTAGRRPGGA